MLRSVVGPSVVDCAATLFVCIVYSGVPLEPSRNDIV